MEINRIMEIADIVEIIKEIGNLPQDIRLEQDQDIFDAGFSSISSLQLLVELEARYDIAIDDDQFIIARTPRALQAMVCRLQEARAA